jgi:hypothetical protein
VAHASNKYNNNNNNKNNSIPFSACQQKVADKKGGTISV